MSSGISGQRPTPGYFAVHTAKGQGHIFNTQNSTNQLDDFHLHSSTERLVNVVSPLPDLSAFRYFFSVQFLSGQKSVIRVPVPEIVKHTNILFVIGGANTAR